MTLADHQALASGQDVRLSSGSQHISVELVAKLPNFTPKPLATFPANVDLTNPFALVGVGNQLYVTDGGQNAVVAGRHPERRSSGSWLNSRTSRIRCSQPSAGPTKRRSRRASHTRVVGCWSRSSPARRSPRERPPFNEVFLNGSQTPFLTGLKTAIGVLPIDGDDDDARRSDDDGHRGDDDDDRDTWCCRTRRPDRSSTGQDWSCGSTLTRPASRRCSPTA